MNDGSTDDTARVAEQLSVFDSRVQLINQTNQGLPSARNRGLATATAGQLVHFLDADDFILPEMYECTVDAFLRQPDAAAVYTGHQLVSGTGVLQKLCPVLPESPDLYHDLLERNPWPCHSVILNRSMLDAVGVFDTRLKSCEDWDLWLRIAAMSGKFVPVKGEFACYRRFPDSMSTNGDTMLEAGYAVLRKRHSGHKTCALCKIAIHHGKNRWRNWLWTTHLSLQAQRLLDGGDLLKFLRLLVRVAHVDPRVGIWLLSTFRHHLNNCAQSS